MTLHHPAFSTALLDPNAPAPVPDTIGFSVYRNNSAFSLTEAMKAQFPAVVKLMGGELFARAALAYVRRHPIMSPLLFQIGSQFAEFLEQTFSAQSHKFVPDIARIEYAMATSQHAADAQPMQIAALQDIDPERLADVKLALLPATRIIRSNFPAVTITAENREEAEPSGEICWQSEDALITRPDMRVQIRTLPPGGALFLHALSERHALGEAVTRTKEIEPHFELTLNLTVIFAAGAIGALHPI